MKSIPETPQTKAANISVLTAASPNCNTVKTYYIDAQGQLQCINYKKAKHFNYKLVQSQGIEQFSTLLTTLSKQSNAMLIRGLPIPGLPMPTPRPMDNFPEPETGSYWVMIDFDHLPLPEGMNPNSVEAIELTIQKLPKAFHEASYFYQFSSSAGILKPDGEPLKPGLNVHVFFWFQRPIHGKQLSAYLESYCYDTEFYEKIFDRSDHPTIKLGVDLSVIRSSVQPHYVGLPIIRQGVKCNLPAEDRQGLVKKSISAVDLPVFADSLRSETATKKSRISNAWKMECGFVKAKITTRAAHGGISVSTFHRNPNGPSPSTNKIFLNAESYGDNEDAIILYFEGEGSPGSYFVKKISPQLAIRFGDYDSIPLKELSDGAYAYVRDDLQWFSEIPHIELPLTDAGYLPDIQSFATARNALIIAPTGSGKTEAFCHYAASRNAVIFYAAQTIALVDQMYCKLSNFGRSFDEFEMPVNRGVKVIRYTDFHMNGGILRPGYVYDTTNESLHKFIEAAISQGLNYELIIDEIHVALDDFMAIERKNKLLEQAIGRANRSIFMTGTITNLQVSKLLDTVSRACGALTPEVYTGYQFQPVKENPLFLADVSKFGADFVALLRHYQELKKDGKPIPRTVIIVPGTEMRVYELLLENFELLEDSCVVSRPESFQDDIEAARISRLPILISSPVFALGLNFEEEPIRFWTYFSYLQVDESQIIQTLNRANRGAVQCEVRLYYGELDSTPVMLPKAELERLKIEAYLLDESTVQGMLDSHFQIDRVTYISMREAEKKTAKSLYNLIENDGFQNYRIQTEWEDVLTTTKEDFKENRGLFTSFKKAAAASYMSDIAEYGELYKNEPDALLLDYLEKLFLKKSEYGDSVTQVPRDIENKEYGVCMALCGVSAGISTSVKPARIRRLFGELRPYLTAQYSHEKTGEWRNAIAEKTLTMISLLEYLKRMSNGQLHSHAFAALMKRPGLRNAVKALADSETNYIAWLRKLDRLDEISDLIRNSASDKQRAKLKAEQFEVAQEFLKSIGVSFGKMEIDGRNHTDPTKPIVPNWDFDRMIAVLYRNAESYKRLPESPVDKVQEDYLWAGANVSKELCASCVHCSRNFFCAMGKPIQPFWDDIEATTLVCSTYRKIPVKLAAWEPTKI